MSWLASIGGLQRGMDRTSPGRKARGIDRAYLPRLLRRVAEYEKKPAIPKRLPIWESLAWSPGIGLR
jgi:hypothetical protein